MLVGGRGRVARHQANLYLRYLGGGWVFRLINESVGRMSTCVMHSRMSIFMLHCDAFASALAHSLSRIHTYAALRCLAHQCGRTRVRDESMSRRMCVDVGASRDCSRDCCKSHRDPRDDEIGLGKLNSRKPCLRSLRNLQQPLEQSLATPTENVHFSNACQTSKHVPAPSVGVILGSCGFRGHRTMLWDTFRRNYLR